MKMLRYSYIDHEKNKIVFQIVALNISHADELYKDAGHGDVKKQSHVGCMIEEIKKHE
jgi:hypothetical protein